MKARVLIGCGQRRALTLALFAGLIALLGAAPPDYSAAALELHHDAIVCDLHADTSFLITYENFNLMKRHRTVDWGPAGIFPLFSDIDYHRARQGGLDLFNISICPSPKDQRPGSKAFVRRGLRALERMFDQNRDYVALAKSPADVRRIELSGRLAVFLGVEGGQALEGSLDTLHEFYDRGVRSVTLSHAKTHGWAESASDQGSPDFDGLSDFGRDVVKEMERMGMMIDLAHVAPATFWATLQTVSGPVIVSHAAARGLGDHPRNLDDEQILAVAQRGGVIGVIFYPKYLDPAGTRPVDVGLIVDHIDYIRDLAGVDVIALGSDFDGDVTMPKDLSDASRLPALTQELLRRGYSAADVRKILGENFLRAWEKIEARAQK